MRSLPLQATENGLPGDRIILHHIRLPTLKQYEKYSISSENVTSNDAVTLTLKISGTGNIRLIQTPELQLPSDFEVYD